MRARYVWDYDISEQQFDALLAGKAALGRLDRAWAAARPIQRSIRRGRAPDRLRRADSQLAPVARSRPFLVGPTRTRLPRRVAAAAPSRAAGLAVDPAWFEEVLYPFQDEVLAVAARVETGFYLTGGTALGRVHLRHRYSDDLNLFVNDDDRFQTWADRLLEAWRAEAGWQLGVQRRDPRFVRALVSKGEVQLKVEFVNDVRGRVGVPTRHEGFGLVDTRENILANKVTALLDREEPKASSRRTWRAP
jgi:hypothetical protein